jgi:hypothetical protein
MTVIIRQLYSNDKDHDNGWQSITVIIRQILFKSRTMTMADIWTHSDHQAEDLQVENYGCGWQLNMQWWTCSFSSSRGRWLWLTFEHTVIIRQKIFKSRIMNMLTVEHSDHQADSLQVEDDNCGWYLNTQWSSGSLSSCRGLWLWLTVEHSDDHAAFSSRWRWWLALIYESL